MVKLCEMKLLVPFYPMPNRMKNYCGQYILKSIFKYYLKKDYGVRKLARLSKKFEHGFTLTMGLAYAALHEGLNVRYITTSKKLEDKEAEKHYRKNINSVSKKAEELYKKSKKLGLEEDYRKSKLEDLINELNKNKLIITIIDYGRIYKIKKQIFHFVLLTGYNKNNIYFHDVGPHNPAANKKINKKLFYEAYSAKGTSMDTLIFWRRSQNEKIRKRNFEICFET